MDHLGIAATSARCAILTGDPDRARQLAEFFGGGHVITTRRGFAISACTVDTTDFLVVASGIGGPSTAIAIEELAQLGIQSLIRIGTCGALQSTIRPLQVVVSTGSVRDEGTTRQYVNISFPAVPDFELTLGLRAALEALGVRAHFGITHSKDAYYAEKPSKQLLPDVAAQRWRWLRLAGVLATEMEAATLFVLGSLRSLRTAALFVSVGPSTRPEEVTGLILSVAPAITATLRIATTPLPSWVAPCATRGDDSYLTRTEDDNL